VKRWSPFALLLTLSLSSCEILLPPALLAYGPDDYAIGEAQPFPQEAKLAKLRLRNFVRRADPRQRLALSRNPYVAIQANEIAAGDDWQLLRELSSGQVRATSLYASDFRNRSAFGVKFLLILNSRTGRLLRPIGILAADTPGRGAVGEFAGVKAIYEGTGWW
jgi:hypothetical protein